MDGLMVGPDWSKDMADHNLWATPARPKSISITVERLWTEGEDVVGVTVVTRGSKQSEPVWASYQRLEGPAWELASKGIAEAALSRFHSSLWDVEPRQSSYADWVELWTT